MPDLESSKPELNESPEPSTELLQAPQAPSGYIPNFRELTATYEMIVKSRAAIRENNYWSGADVEAIAMLLTMLGQMEGQYRAQLEQAKEREKDALKRARVAIKEAGGQVNGDVSTVPTNQPAS